MRTILMFIHIAVSLSLIGLVLLQHGRGADAGAAFGSGSSQTLFGARGSSSFLTRATAVLAAVFFTTSLTLAYMSSQLHHRQSVTDLMGPTSTTGQPVGTSPQPKEPTESTDLPTSQIPLQVPAKAPESATPANPAPVAVPVAPVSKSVTDDLPTVQIPVQVPDSTSVTPAASVPVVSVPAEQTPAVEHVSVPETAQVLPPPLENNASSSDSATK